MISVVFQISRINEGYLILFSGLVIVFSALLLLSLFFKYGLQPEGPLDILHHFI